MIGNRVIRGRVRYVVSVCVVVVVENFTVFVNHASTQRLPDYLAKRIRLKEIVRQSVGDDELKHHAGSLT